MLSCCVDASRGSRGVCFRGQRVGTSPEGGKPSRQKTVRVLVNPPRAAVAQGTKTPRDEARGGSCERRRVASSSTRLRTPSEQVRAGCLSAPPGSRIDRMQAVCRAVGSRQSRDPERRRSSSRDIWVVVTTTAWRGVAGAIDATDLGITLAALRSPGGSGRENATLDGQGVAISSCVVRPAPPKRSQARIQKTPAEPGIKRPGH